VALIAAVIESVHVVFEPVHAPAQSLKSKPFIGAAVSVTVVPGAKEAVQVVPQSMPAGEELTEPEPVTVIFRACFGVGSGGGVP